MRQQLIQYVELLFAGASGAGDIKQEILQNTLDRYDDLVAQGKSEQAAYSLAISGIGDISEILENDASAKVQYVAGTTAGSHASYTPADVPMAAWKKVVRAIGIFLYIICPIPLIVLSEIGMDTIGLCGTLSIVAIATALMVISGGKNSKEEHVNHAQESESELEKAISKLTGIIGICIYLVISFSTNAWYITWVIFPIMGAVKGLIKACMDLKEANKYEN